MTLRYLACCIAVLISAALPIAAQYRILPASFNRSGSVVIPVVPTPIAESVEAVIDGTPVSIDSIICPSDASPVPLHSILAIDVSGSMARGGPNILLAKEAARSWIRGLTNGSTCAITSFDNLHYLNIDATDDTSSLLSVIDRLRPRGGTSYRQGLMGMPYGALRIAASTPRRRVVVFLTDGAGTIDTSEVLAFARSNNIAVYCISLGMSMPSPLRTLAERSGGLWFENITTVTQAVDVYSTIALVAGTPQPCYVFATPSSRCSTFIRGTVRIGNQTSEFSAELPTEFQQSVEVTPISSYIGVVPANQRRSVRLYVKTTGKPVTIVGLKGASPATLRVADGALPLTVAAGTSAHFDVDLTVADTTYTMVPIDVVADSSSCQPPTVFVMAGSPLSPMTTPSLRILHPTSSSDITAKTKVEIRYSGVPVDVPVSVDVSLDNGSTWKAVAASTTGGKVGWSVPDTAVTTVRVRVRQLVTGRSSKSAGAPLQESVSDVLTISRSTLSMRDVRFAPQHVGSVRDSLVQGAIVNRGKRAVTIVALRLEGTQSMDFGLHTAAPFRLAAGDSVQVELAFQPQAPGERATMLVAEFDDGQRIGVRLTGRALPPLLQASASSLDFGDVPINSTDERFIKDAIVNTGRSTLIVRSVRRVGPDDTSFAVMSPSSFRLAPGESHTIHAAFHPIDDGRRSTAIEFLVDGVDQPITVMLFGRGVEPTTAWHDPTTFRSIILPTAVVPPAGTITLGVYDAAGYALTASLTNNIAVLVGGTVPFSNQWIGVDESAASTQLAWSAGAKCGWNLDTNLIIGGGLQHGMSHYDRIGTPELVESRITFTAAWATLGVGTDDSRLNLYAGYAFKDHNTAFTGRFNADATIMGLAYDARIARSWKICSEAFFMRTLPFVPITVTARYFGESYALEAGVTCIAIPASGQPAPSLPIVPMLTFVKRW